MDKTELLDKIYQTIESVVKHDNFEKAEVLSANDVDGWDSLSHMLIISSIEEQFAVKFKMRELSKMNNVGDLADIIITKK